MDVALLLARLLLAIVFVVAGVAKLIDRAGSRQAVVDFGVPSYLAAPLGVLLPLAELAVAAALLLASSAWWGAVGALVLLSIFLAGIGANLARGRRPVCRCFGQLSSKPAGWNTLARNGVLAVVAAFIVWQGYGGAGHSALGWLASPSATMIVGVIFGLALLGLIVAQWLFLWNLLGQNGRLLMRVDALERQLGADSSVAPPPDDFPSELLPGLPVGQAAPDFELQDLRGEVVTLATLRAAGKPVMLLFTDPDCGPCTALLPEIRRWQKEHSEKLTLSLVSRGTLEENRAKSTEHGLRGVLLQDDWEISEAYEVESTPSAVLVRLDGTIGSPVQEGVDSISGFLEYAVGESSRPPMDSRGQRGVARAATRGLRIGDPAPRFELPDLNGATLTLRYFEGEKLIILFWDPECGFCREMLPDLRTREKDPSKEASKLLVVSTGTRQANREMGLSSPVVLDEQLAVGPAYGAPGAPSAVLVDEHGRIATELAVGTPAVLALLAQSLREARANASLGS
jgi:methylamine dehydrogenase accessory protein MauD